MKLVIDTETQTAVVDGEEIPLYSDRGFEVLSDVWLKVGWNQKYPYAFSWMGRPIIQIPEDIVRMQEVICSVKPDVVLETGIAHGGSLIFTASLMKAMDRGRVIGIDIEIRPHNRKAIEEHPLFPWITLIEGSSVEPHVVDQASSLVEEGETVMVVLDSNHSKEHVAEELEAYHRLVTVGSYIVATDGSQKDLHDVPRGKPGWVDDNPLDAALEFAEAHPEFVIEQPAWPFNESTLSKNITHWPSAFLKRVR